MGNKMMPVLLTINEAAVALAVSPSTVKRMIRAGDLAIVRWGRVTRVPEVAVNNMVARMLHDEGLSDLAARVTDRRS